MDNESHSGFELESELRDKLSILERGVAHGVRTNYEVRRLKGGPFRSRPIEIQSRIALERNSPVYARPDSLAHQLTMLGEDLPEAFFARIKKILLLPEAVCSGSHLLTHVYWPGRLLLAMYLYPLRLHEGGATTSHSRLHANHRFPTQLGLLGQVLGSIVEMPSSVPEDQTHQYVIPLELMDTDELRLLEDTQQLYSRHI